MRIREIRAAGLGGATPEGGWEGELVPEDCVHTLMAVITDEGLTGLGSVFTSDKLVHAALALLEPFYRGFPFGVGREYYKKPEGQLRERFIQLRDERLSAVEGITGVAHDDCLAVDREFPFSRQALLLD